MIPGEQVKVREFPKTAFGRKSTKNNYFRHHLNDRLKPIVAVVVFLFKTADHTSKNAPEAFLLPP